MVVGISGKNGQSAVTPVVMARGNENARATMVFTVDPTVQGQRSTVNTVSLKVAQVSTLMYPHSFKCL